MILSVIACRRPPAVCAIRDKLRVNSLCVASEFIFTGHVGDDDEWRGSSEEEEGEEEEYSGEDISTERGESIDSPRRSDRERFSSLPTYAQQWQRKREAEATALEEVKKERFRKLMGVDLGRGDGESIKTILSEEEVVEKKSEEEDEEASSDESINVCLKTIEISDSQLKLYNIYRDYPVPEDPGLVPAFWVLYPPPMHYKEDGIKKFEDLVKEMGLVPSNLIKEMLQTDTINLRHWGIDPRIFRALCKAIPNNTTVQNIDLRDTPLTPDCCCHLASLLMKNGIISRVDLSGCKIGVEGAKKLQDGISVAAALTQLDLRRCNLGDEGVQYIASGIKYSPTLEDINLSDNRLGEDSARSLSSIFLQTEVLKRLDLSWNSLFGKEFATNFFRGLARNETIEYLNMSWNGLGQDSAAPLSGYLANNRSLREFDLSDNRFNALAGAQIAKALSKNTGLEVLRLGGNPLESAGALALVKAVVPDKSPDLQLKTLDLKNVWAEKDILPSLENLKTYRPQLEVKLGGILSNYKLHGPDPRKIFLKRANFETMSPKKKKLRKNFGHLVLSLQDEPVPRATFKESINKGKFILSDAVIDELMNCFAIPKGRVDQTALKEFYLKEYPDTQPPPPKTPKSARKKKKTAES